MSMPRKHFEAIAEAIRVTRNDTAPEHVHAHNALDRLAQNVAANLKKFNPAFDKDRFYEACGVGKW